MNSPAAKALANLPSRPEDEIFATSNQIQVTRASSGSSGVGGEAEYSANSFSRPMSKTCQPSYTTLTETSQRQQAANIHANVPERSSNTYDINTEFNVDSQSSPYVNFSQLTWTTDQTGLPYANLSSVAKTTPANVHDVDCRL